MYAKCGSLEDAWKVSTRWHHVMWSLGVPYFEDVPCMDMVRKLLNILNRCVKKVYSPDDITFICLLSACSHAGLVDEGMRGMLQ
jgi:hypothetical protein